MNTKIKDTFWDDEAVGTLVDPEKPDHAALVSLLWLMTAKVNAAGWVDFSMRTFAFHTGCNREALGRACEALGKGIVTHEKGFWLRNFIRHQIGTGKRLAANKIAGSVVHCFHHMPMEIVKEVLLQYPELTERVKKADTELSEALGRACYPLRDFAKGKGEGEGEGEGEGWNGSAEGKGPISLADALTFAKRWCENSPSMIAFDAVQVELWFADRERKQWQATSGQVIGSREQAEKDLTFWLLKAKTGQTPSRPGSGERGKTSSLQKKERGGPAAHPLAVPPCADWKKLARAVCERAEVTDMSWLDVADWGDLAGEDKQAVWDEFNSRKNGGAA